jgi:hypothetical protein
MNRFVQRTFIAASLSLALAGTAVAQAPRNGGPGADAKSDAKSDAKPDAKPCTESGGSGDLSNKLSQSNSVICPPDVDPAMKAPTPNIGKMPVIPPPGSPGGNQNVQPK